MLAVFRACFLFWCLQIAVAKVMPPQNPTLITLNTWYTLRWDWDERAAENRRVYFSTQYLLNHMLRRRNPEWSTLCDNTSQTHCDLPASALGYLNVYMLRVRATVDGRHSDWVRKEFCPDRDAVLGPPSKVSVAPAGSDLEVNITDPLSSNNSSMRKHVRDLCYRITYWEPSADSQALNVHMLDTSASLVTLPHLKPRTLYCVSVQSRADYYNKTSNFTSPHCMQTEGPTPFWQILLFFLGSMVFCFVVVLLTLCCIYKWSGKLKATFSPPIQLPPHLKEYLYDCSPGSDIPRLLTPDLEAEVFDKLSIFTNSDLLEIHIPPPCEPRPAPSSGLEPDSSGRHSRQHSGGSGDSGVYSTESSGSRRQQPSSAQSCTGPDVSWQGSSDLEQVKMLDFASGDKNRRLIEDEGIVDFCV